MHAGCRPTRLETPCFSLVIVRCCPSVRVRLRWLLRAASAARWFIPPVSRRWPTYRLAAPAVRSERSGRGWRSRTGRCSASVSPLGTARRRTNPRLAPGSGRRLEMVVFRSTYRISSLRSWLRKGPLPTRSRSQVPQGGRPKVGTTRRGWDFPLSRLPSPVSRLPSSGTEEAGPRKRDRGSGAEEAGARKGDQDLRGACPLPRTLIW